MVRGFLVVGLAVALVFGAAGLSSSGAQAEGFGPLANAVADVVVDRANFPSRLALAPDGRLFYAELNGGIRVVQNGQLSPVVFFTDPAIVPGILQLEGGLLGIAFDPSFAANGHVYLYYTYVVSQGDNPVFRNKVVRVTEQSGRGVNPQVLVDNIPAGIIGNGGALRFGPDGKLYITTGYTGDPQRINIAQRLDSLAGKTLRINPDGTIPSDNPFPGSPVWSYGHRNVYGMTFDRRTGNLWAAENGPECRDQIEIVRRGGNYGWNDEFACDDTNEPAGTIPPVWTLPRPVGLTDAAFVCPASPFGLQDTLLIAYYDDFELVGLQIGGERRDQVLAARLLWQFREGEYPLSFEAAPTGEIYVAVPNRIYRLRPATASSGNAVRLQQIIVNAFSVFLPLTQQRAAPPSPATPC